MFEKGHFNLGLTASIVVGLLIAYVLISLLHNVRTRPVATPPTQVPVKKAKIGFEAKSEDTGDTDDTPPVDD